MSPDRFVDGHDGIRLAVRDHGGDGRDLLLMHGAGSHLLSLEHLVGRLAEDGGLRVVTMDQRWSGQSGDSPEYSWDDLVRDVDAVVDQLGLRSPVVAGHSWGGMIAAYWGAAHPEATGVVNLDGHGSGHPSMYEGMTEEEVTHGVAMIQSIQDPFAGHASEGDDAWRASMRETVWTVQARSGIPTHLLDDFTDRNFVSTSPGTWRRHPGALILESLRGDLDLFSVYRRVECPFQIFNCTAPMPEGVPPELQGLMAAYRRGLGKALDALAAERPNVCVVALPDVDHQGILGRGARAVAAEVRAFLANLH